MNGGRRADEGGAIPSPLSSALRPRLSKRFVQQRLELLDVQRHLADRRRRRRGTAGVDRLLVLGADLAEDPFEIWRDEGVRAHIAGLFLAPHEFRLLEAAELLHQRFQRHRIELLHTQKIDVIDAALLAFLVEVVIDLTRTHYDTPDL